MAIRVGFQKSGITPEDHRHYASTAIPPAAALTSTSGLTTAGGALVSTGAMTATISAFRATIQGTSNSLQSAYPFVNDATAAITITDGHATLPRQDLVVAQVRDNPYDSSGQQDGRIYVVAGTAAASPVAPPVPTSAIPLWEVRVNAGANAGNGGVVWGSALTDRRTYTGWSRIDTGAWTSYTPTWTASGGGASLGNGTLAGRWMRVGRLITVRTTLVLGSTTSAGSGYWSFSVPVVGATTTAGQAGLGSALATDAGVGVHHGVAMVGSAEAVVIAFSNAEDTPWGPASGPITWGNGDSCTLMVSYEGAT
ncbi:hypothetical protein B4N89_20520 [Embleya scabrispora]|uniref:Uncharacterized protein n=1 Tax=Embleya scabrispora TaxID=159449 RepID=A0A1T3P283_9ACTN|nr:hypothetical protein [Embleya scabrispora]OPC83000.1 hypothetical protein B4N89_20520 [Embleya scabrispora]